MAFDSSSNDSIQDTDFVEETLARLRQERDQEATSVPSFAQNPGLVSGGVPSAGDDVLTSDTEGDVIDGLAGNDILYGRGGNDTLLGGLGNDILDGGEGDDILNGGAGSNVIKGGNGNDRVNVGAVGSFDTADGGAGYDILDFGALAADGHSVVLNLNLVTQINTIHGAASGRYVNFEEIRGSQGDDFLAGDARNNIFYGNSGVDEISGEGGNDILHSGSGGGIFGGDGNDFLVVGRNAHIVASGGEGQDLFTADDADVAQGEEGVIVDFVHNEVRNESGSLSAQVDLVERFGGSHGADLFVGSDTVDTVSYETSLAGITASLTGRVFDEGAVQVIAGTNLDEEGKATVFNAGDAEGDIFTPLIDNLIGSKFNDILEGNNLVNLLQGGLGNDILIHGGTRANQGGGGDILNGGEGTDWAVFSFVDRLIGSTNGIYANLNTGKAYLDYAGLGGQIGDNAPNGTGNYDTLISVENLVGSDFDDVLVGNRGRNVFVGGLGADYMEGGAGTDYASYANVLNANNNILGLTIDMQDGDHGTGAAEGDRFSNVEGIIGTIYNDTILGDNGNNLLYGGAGDDVLDGGRGNDFLDGGTGFNTLDYLNFQPNGPDNVAALTLNITKADGSGTVNIVRGNGRRETDTFVHIDSFVAPENGTLNFSHIKDANTSISVSIDNAPRLPDLNGDGFQIRTLGQPVNASVSVQGFHNVLGGAGSDIIAIGTGVDHLIRGNGGDDVVRLAGIQYRGIYDGGSGYDRLDLIGLTNGVDFTLGVAVSAAQVETAIGFAEQTVVSHFEEVLGTNHADTIVGDNAANRLYGNAGNDILNGGGGNDFLQGGLGNDIIGGGSGVDTLSYEDLDKATQSVVVDLGGGIATITDTANPGNGRDGEQDSLQIVRGVATIENVIGGSGDDHLTGNSLANLLQGGGGADTLNGGLGNDILIGGTGNDILSGEAGSNRLTGGAGSDILHLEGGSADRVLYTSTADGGTTVSAADVITGFVNSGNQHTIIDLDVLFDGAGANFNTGNSTAITQARANAITVAVDPNDTHFVNISVNVGQGQIFLAHIDASGITGGAQALQAQLDQEVHHSTGHQIIQFQHG